MLIKKSFLNCHPKKIYHPFSKKGASFAEIMLAVGILGIAIVALMALYSNCVFLSARAERMTVAITHAQYVLEHLRNSTIAEIEAGDWSTWAANQGLDTLSNEVITVTDAGTDPLSVTVAVSWQDRSGTQSISFTTKITD